MKRYLIIGAVVVATALTVGTTRIRADVKTVARIVAQPGAPITITSYAASYGSRSQYSQEGISHYLVFQNNTAKEVVAAQFGLVSFDVFNQFLDRTNGLSTDAIAAGKTQKGGWVASAYGAFAFMSGVAYVNRVRFADGEIWTADMGTIVDELQKIEKDFDASILKKKDGPGK
jgi:hypothetical protein